MLISLTEVRRPPVLLELRSAISRRELNFRGWIERILSWSWHKLTRQMFDLRIPFVWPCRERSRCRRRGSRRRPGPGETPRPQCLSRAATQSADQHTTTSHVDTFMDLKQNELSLDVHSCEFCLGIKYFFTVRGKVVFIVQCCQLDRIS